MLRRLPISATSREREIRALLAAAPSSSFAGMAALGVGVQVEVRQEPEVEPGPPRHEALGQVERDAVGVGAEERREPDVAVRHERQGRQEMLAELAVGDPRRSVLVGLERERVDQDRPGVAELDVVGRGVLERPAGGQRLELDVQGQQRRVLELAERPLEGIRDELDLVGPDDGTGVGRRGLVETSAASWPISRPASIRRLARPLATKASQSSIDAASI